MTDPPLAQPPALTREAVSGVPFLYGDLKAIYTKNYTLGKKSLPEAQPTLLGKAADTLHDMTYFLRRQSVEELIGQRVAIEVLEHVGRRSRDPETGRAVQFRVNGYGLLVIISFVPDREKYFLPTGWKTVTIVDWNRGAQLSFTRDRDGYAVMVEDPEVPAETLADYEYDYREACRAHQIMPSPLSAQTTLKPG